MRRAVERPLRDALRWKIKVEFAEVHRFARSPLAGTTRAVVLSTTRRAVSRSSSFSCRAGRMRAAIIAAR